MFLLALSWIIFVCWFVGCGIVLVVGVVWLLDCWLWSSVGCGCCLDMVVLCLGVFVLMRALGWNCRGICNALTVRALRDQIKGHRLDIIFFEPDKS